MLNTDEYRIAPPVSHHFGDEAVGDRIVGLADALELRDNGIDPATNDRLLYHAEVDAALKWDEDDRTRLAEMQATHDPSLVSVHLGRRYQRADTVDGRFVGVGDPYSRSQLRTNVAENVATLRDIFSEAQLLVENNNHLGTDAYDVVTEPTFLATVVRANDIGFLFDIAHAKITAQNTDVELEEYVSALPLDRCRQVHLSRHGHGQDGAVDTHSFLRVDDWEYFDTVAEALPNLTYVTLEYYRDATVLLDQLTRMQCGSSDLVVADEHWDSQFFGRSIASLVADSATEECLEYAVVRSREADVDCLYFETDDEAESRAARSRGFELVDSSITFERQINDGGDESSSETVRPVRESDRPRLRQIAGDVFQETRFYNDPHFDDETCDELYSTWIDNACDDYADEVLVTTETGEPTGFITCRVSDASGEIGLVGVTAAAQGQGTGSRLVAAAVDWFRDQGLQRVSVDTQATNESAKNLYRSAGFTHCRQTDVLHYWTDDDRS